jgi:transcriptional regulator with XRE-family HTH domain
MKGLTQLELADAVGLTRGKIATYETEAVVPPYPTIVKLAAFFSISPDELTKLDEEQVERLYIAKQTGKMPPIIKKQPTNDSKEKLIQSLEKALSAYEKLNEEKDKIINELRAKIKP